MLLQFVRGRLDDDESIGYVHPLLQLKTVTSMLMIRSDEEFGFSDHDVTRMEGGSCIAVLVASSTRTVLPQQSCEDRIGLSL